MYKLQCLALVCVLGPACGTDNRLEYFFTNAVLIAKEQPAANTSRDSRPAVCYGERYLHSESFVRTALEDARVRPVFSAEPCGHRVRVRGTESITDCENLTAWQPGRHQCLPLRDLKFPPGV